MIKKVIWIGPIIPKQYLHKYKAVSAAANDWQLEFINHLKLSEIDIEIISYIPEPSWPRGKFISKDSYKFVPYKLYYISYINIYLIRDYMLFFKMKNLLNKLQSKNFHIITYNPSWVNNMIGTFFKKNYANKWFSIIADGYESARPDYFIFLSYYNYIISKYSNKIHINGAPVLPLEKTKAYVNNKNSNSKRIILFCGSIDKWTGIDNFALYFNDNNSFDFELHIYGKGNDQLIINLAKYNSKIVYFGFVNDDVLHDACLNAFAFVNPRPTNLPGIENNFPSKLFKYISYGKPILSSKTLGLSDEFNNLIIYYEPNDINSLLKSFEYIDNLSKNDLYTIHNLAIEFCKENTWEKQIDKITNIF